MQMQNVDTLSKSAFCVIDLNFCLDLYRPLVESA